MRRALLPLIALTSVAVLAAALSIAALADQGDNVGWAQWGQNQKHQGNVSTEGQDVVSTLADKVYDPFTAAEEDSTGGDLLVHYQVPILEGNNVFMEFKTGSFTGNSTWNSQIWNQRRLSWEGGQLVEKWNFQSDWKPEPRRQIGQNIWEPVYHAVLSGNFIYDPGLGGTIFKLDKNTGANLGRINPFDTIDPNVFVAGPLTADRNGNIYYNVVKTDIAVATPPARATVQDGWLVKVSSSGAVSKVKYADLMAPANPLTSCVISFEPQFVPSLGMVV